MKPGEGFFRIAGAPTYRLDIADPEMGGIATQLVVREGDAHAFQFVRLKVADKQIAEVETIVARKGESGPMFVPRCDRRGRSRDEEQRAAEPILGLASRSSDSQQVGRAMKRNFSSGRGCLLEVPTIA